MSYRKSENQAFLLRLWKPVLFLVPILAISLYGGFFRQDATPALSTSGGLLFAVVLFFAIRWNIARKFEALLRLEQPDKLSEYYSHSFRRAPHGKYYAAGQTAIVLALYGKIDSANSALRSVKWEQIPPMIKAQETIAQSIIHYASGEFIPGINLAKHAKGQGEVSPLNPGAKVASLAYDTYLHLGKALNGTPNPETPNILLSGFEKLPLLGKLLSAWGLSAIAKSEQDEEQFNAMRDFVANKAPHFSAILASFRKFEAP